MIDPIRTAALVQAEARRRRNIEALAEAGGDYHKAAQGLLSRNYAEQAAAVSDPARLTAALGTRRSGKSSGWLRKLLYDAVTTPGSHQLYINTSKPECRRIAVRGSNPGDGLSPLNRRFNLGGVESLTDMTFTFPNGAIIELLGADDIRGIERALGLAPHRVLIDEAQKMPHLDYAIKEVLGPAMEDFQGQIAMIGTPSRDCSGLFYEVTSECEHEDKENCVHTQWSVHFLSILYNPHFGESPEERSKIIERYCKRNSLDMEEPVVQRVWFGRWVKEDSNFVYHVHRVNESELCYAPMRWLVEPKRKPPYMQPMGGVVDWHRALAELPRKTPDIEYDWWFILGCDIAHSPDPFAWTLWAWCNELPFLYEVASWKQLELIVDEQMAEVEDIGRRFESRLVGVEADAGGGGKLVVKSWVRGLAERFPVPINAAEKGDKEVNQELMNNDIRAGRVKLRKGSPLHEEMVKLTWRMKGNKREENVRRDSNGTKRSPNDCCDGGLYAFRGARHHRYTQPKPKLVTGSEAFYSAEEKAMEEEALLEAALLEEMEEGYGYA